MGLKFQQFHKMVETQFHAKIQTLCYDNDGERINHDLHKFLQDHGIIHPCLCPYTPKKNLVEWKNRHVLEVVSASLFDVNMPQSFWGEVVIYVTYLINRIPSSISKPLSKHLTTTIKPPTLNLEPQVLNWRMPCSCIVIISW